MYRLIVTLAAGVIVAGSALAETQRQRSFKGWELYSWREDNDWRFSLLLGTNRTKYCTEVQHPKAAMTLERLEEALSKLADAEYVTWEAPKSAVLRNYCEIAYPPPDIVERLRQLCRRLELTQVDNALPPNPAFR
jgi:hypothetical protein